VKWRKQLREEGERYGGGRRGIYLVRELLCLCKLSGDKVSRPHIKFARLVRARDVFETAVTDMLRLEMHKKSFPLTFSQYLLQMGGYLSRHKIRPLGHVKSGLSFNCNWKNNQRCRSANKRIPKVFVEFSHVAFTLQSWQIQRRGPNQTARLDC
jgi:hypothetical protein